MVKTYLHVELICGENFTAHLQSKKTSTPNWFEVVHPTQSKCLDWDGRIDDLEKAVSPCRNVSPERNT